MSVWSPGSAPLAVIMISLNEAHNMEAVLDNLEGWAQEVFLVDSYSSDATVDSALARGVHVAQRRFQGFGDQWNFAIKKLPITAPWTMKLDPDERLTDELKASIKKAIEEDRHDALIMRRRLWFMGRPLPVRQDILRVWRTGLCHFSDVTVNEHPIVKGKTLLLDGELEHHDSPDLHHWYDKQNRYTTMEAAMRFDKVQLAAPPRLFGNALERRMWLKKIYSHVPFRHQLMFLYCLLGRGAWQAGKAGFIWSRLRAEVYRMREYKYLEMQMLQKSYAPPPQLRGQPDPRVRQFDEVEKGAKEPS
ncbi:MAG TPA: glycosyltransferase family 2 protein [Rhizobiales bacterium]|nr:glycosyltransferase family 2 protein [Hyphomicrobiales bacterium]